MTCQFQKNLERISKALKVDSFVLFAKGKNTQELSARQSVFLASYNGIQ